MCELLSQQYTSAYSTPRDVVHPITEPTDEGETPTLSSFDMNPEDFQEAIKELHTHSGAGPDDIPAVLLKHVGGPLSVPLSIMWKESLRTANIPAIFKKGAITPIPKGGDRTEAKNLRPVALTSHIIKLFEKILVKKLSKFMEDNRLFNAGQHGFRKGRSCLSHLLDHFQKIIDMMNEGTDVDVIYLDFAEAFDKVDHKILLQKLSKLRISGPIYRWIESFLTNRKQIVYLQGSVSEETDVTSGVPQGSVLGPLLFLIHISDISEGLLHSTASSFADDTRILSKVNSTEDCQLLQNDLENVFDWAETNNMKFNSGKFEVMRYAQSGDPIEFEYKTREGTSIARKSETSDLGIIMSDTCKFKEQVRKASAKGRGRAGWICRVFTTRSRMEMLILYKTLVLPHLEYCCPLWCPTDSNLGLIRELENVQRNFTRRIAGMENLNYWGRLKELNLYSLERRRERFCIIYVWKIMNNLAPNFGGAESGIISFYENSRRGILCVIPELVRGASSRLKTIRDNSLGIRGPRLFNALPPELRMPATEDPPSIDAYKSKLDKFLARIPDEPKVRHYSNATSSNSLITKIRRMGNSYS